MTVQKPFDTFAIANYFIEKKSPEVLKLLKMMYFAHGWYLAMYDKPLVDEFFEAWKFGPVLPSVYHEFKRFGKFPITDKAKALNESWDGFTPVEPPSDPQTVEFLDFIIRLYGDRDGFDLVEETHISGGPWSQTIKSCVEKYGFVPRNIDISNDLIKEHFKNLNSFENKVSSGK